MKAPIDNFIPKEYPAGSITQFFAENPALYAHMELDGHNGVDIVAPHGSPLYAVEGGTVCDVKYDSDGFGRHLRILTDGKNARLWVYGHCNAITVEVGDRVEEGDLVATMGNCFDKETEILTDKGWKKFSDLDKTEHVATLNPETEEIEYHKPSHYTKKKETHMWQYRNYHSLDMAVTGNHTMYVELQDGKMHFRNFEDLPKFSWVKQSGGVWNGQEQSIYTVPQTKFRFNGVREDIEIDMDVWLQFLGWFITDGSISNGTSVRITQSFNNPHKRAIIEGMFDSLPFDIKQYKEDYIIYSKQLADHLKSTCPDKDIPAYIFDLSPRQIRIFLDSFWLGDGWRHKSTKYYITPKKESADDLQELIMKCGGYATIKMVDPTLVNRKKPAMIGEQVVVSTKPYYVITEGQHRMAMIKKDGATRVEYNDYAYCVTVQNHIIYVRRNGRPMWCGNTGFVVSDGYASTFWGMVPRGTRGTHLHLGVREVTRTARGWSYPESDIKIDVKNYDNGYKGSIDPMPFIKDLKSDPITKEETKKTLMVGLIGLLQKLIKKQ